MPHLIDPNKSPVVIEVSDDEIGASDCDVTLEGSADVATKVTGNQIQEEHGNSGVICDNQADENPSVGQHSSLAIVSDECAPKVADDKTECESKCETNAEKCTENNNYAVTQTTKSKITYSCHKCNSIFGSRLSFESHYR